jgi:hypothetical protein
VDDRFFKMSEMEHFLQYEDKREAGQHGSSDESIDFFRPTDDGAGEVCVCPLIMKCRCAEASLSFLISSCNKCKASQPWYVYIFMLL